MTLSTFAIFTFAGIGELSILLIILPNIVFAADEIEKLTKSIQKVQEQFNQLEKPISEEAKIIDEGCKITKLSKYHNVKLNIHNVKFLFIKI